MATSREYADFVADRVREAGHVRVRQMFGEFMVYVNDKPLLLLCDNTVYVKKRPEVEVLLGDAASGFPYPGAKEHWVLDIDDQALCLKVVESLEAVTPLPKPRKKKAT